MQLTKTSEYAIRVMVYLANQKEGRLSAMELHKKLNIPYKYLGKMMRNLAAAGLVKSMRGKTGGYMVCCNLEEITLARIIEEVEGLEAYDPVRDAAKHLGDGPRNAEPWRAVHVMESSQYMRNQLLRDADWASMAHSLELRVPLVDARLRRAFAAADFEPARARGKAEVVRLAAPELPAALWDRPKSGFSIPVLRWIADDAGVDAHAGLASRRLALEVLRRFGVDLEAGRG